MSAELSAAVGFVAAGAAAFALTPVAIALARRTGFYDVPREYRKHLAPTPFLGGAAVLIGTLVAALAVGGMSGRHLFLVFTIALWLLGTIDDRVAVPPRWRLLAGALAASGLVAVGLGWHTTGGDGIDFVLSVLWVVGLVNAFNLMDNMDGACGTVGCVSAIGIGTLAAIHGQAALAGLAFGLAGACAGFLPWNLTRPAKIFLGDGGSMTIGFLVAGLSMATCRHLAFNDTNLLVGGLLAGIPMLDTALVTVSRLRRNVRVVTGGRDHLTHRILLALPSPRAVAATLALLQGGLCALAITGDQLGTAAAAAFAISAATVGVLAILVLDTTPWRPADIAVGVSRRARGVGVQSAGAEPR